MAVREQIIAEAVKRELNVTIILLSAFGRYSGAVP